MEHAELDAEDDSTDFFLWPLKVGRKWTKILRCLRYESQLADFPALQQSKIIVVDDRSDPSDSWTAFFWRLQLSCHYFGCGILLCVSMCTLRRCIDSGFVCCLWCSITWEQYISSVSRDVYLFQYSRMSAVY